MHIIFGKDTADGLKDKYTVLELDRIQINPDGPILDSFCVLDNESTRLEEIGTMPNMINIKSSWKIIARKTGISASRPWSTCMDAGVAQ
jgi:uncharacterized protein (DUF4213/DUF364 family)